MSKKFFLLLKTHNKTGLKYLCFHNGTTDTCYTYKGSGMYWLSHLSKHGRDVTTEILKESDSKQDISQEGIRLSIEWDIVNSDGFANLTIEDAQTTAEPLQRQEVRGKRNRMLRERIQKEGMTEKEEKRMKRMLLAAQSDETRKKATKTMIKRHQEQGLSEAERQRSVKQRERYSKDEFTEAELLAHKKCSERQLNKTMAERINNPDYIDPRKGKTAKEIYGNTYTGPWNKGKSLKDIKGEDYTRPTAKSFIVSVNGAPTLFKSEKEFIDATNYKNIHWLKKQTTIIIKTDKHKHKFSKGDVLTFQWMSN